MSGFTYMTPEQVLALPGGVEKRSLKTLRKLAKSNRECQCGERAWKYAGVGMCFSCTTGESDPSEDIELIPSKENGGAA